MSEGVQWFDAEAASRYIGLPVNTIYRLIQDGKLPAQRFPVRVTRHDLDTLIERCRIKPAS